MIISNKEKAMLVVTAVFALYAVVGFTLRKRIDNIRALRREQRDKQELYRQYCDLIAQRSPWEQSYLEKAGMMPVFEEGRQVETHWLGVLDRVASRNHLSVIRRQAGEERQDGDVFEMPIECKEWEGSLESLVGFLYDIHAEGAMLDVRKLYIRPNTSKRSGIRGSFTLYCAYLRGEPAGDADAEPAPEADPSPPASDGGDSEPEPSDLSKDPNG